MVLVHHMEIFGWFLVEEVVDSQLGGRFLFVFLFCVCVFWVEGIGLLELLFMIIYNGYFMDFNGCLCSWF